MELETQYPVLVVIVVTGLVVRRVVTQVLDDMLCPYDVQVILVRILTLVDPPAAQVVPVIIVTVREVIVHVCVLTESHGRVYIDTLLKTVFLVNVR
jgi:NADH:ubiquinone oxidoreductase subunit K